MTAVSVLIPVHDQAAFLGRSLASLMAQELIAWEAVVLDDGSSDHPEEALRPFATDARLRFLSWRGNRGLGATLNVGLAATSAPLVAYLPADDTWDSNHLLWRSADFSTDASTSRWHGAVSGIIRRRRPKGR
ncbi:MAG: glycosyltransferase family 2 protein [Nocardioidaceae bacterium]|nr:glycosyltransferase family 2 protein [Nocardioidaceae bacterium]